MGDFNMRFKDDWNVKALNKEQKEKAKLAVLNV